MIPPHLIERVARAQFEADDVCDLALGWEQNDSDWKDYFRESARVGLEAVWDELVAAAEADVSSRVLPSLHNYARRSVA